MDAKLKEKWVKALLSGEYSQGSQYLYKDGSYCCLGVLRDVADPGSEEQRDYSQLLSDEQLERFGLTHNIQCSLADDLNDTGVPFEMIAGLIDQAL